MVWVVRDGGSVEVGGWARQRARTEPAVVGGGAFWALCATVVGGVREKGAGLVVAGAIGRLGGEAAKAVVLRGASVMMFGT